MTTRLRIITTGLIAQYPLAGVTWDYVQYVLGLAQMGHDVYYIEDTGQWPYNPEESGISKTCDYNVRYLAGVMERFGLGDRWAYRFPWESQWFGLPDAQRNEVIASADLVLNISGILCRADDYRPARLAYIDSDPVFTQVKLARGQADFRKLVDAHDVHFSFGEHITEAVPSTGHDWRPTRQPIILSEWQVEAPRRDVFTTVMNWTSYKPVEYQGRTYGQKDVEFKRFLDLPARVAPTALEIAINAGKTARTPYDLLRHKGWQVVDPLTTCPDLDSYRSYIASSLAEWSVAKNGYVVDQPGWFSCRSACYLAAGRPVVVQDTGFGAVLPVGEGILPFTTVDQAVDAVGEVQRNYAVHSGAARSIAEEYFDSRRVLGRLIEEALNPAVHSSTEGIPV